MTEIINRTPRMVSLKECSEETGLSYYALRRMCLNNEIVYLRVGSKILVNMDLLIEKLNGKEV